MFFAQICLDKQKEQVQELQQDDENQELIKPPVRTGQSLEPPSPNVSTRGQTSP